MKKVLVLILVLCFAGWAAPAQAAPPRQGTPLITSFTTPVTQVDRLALARRTARVPVSWTTADRPVTANLVFEQVLPDGSAINVELPRPIPWVASAGDGVAAPILPGWDVPQITLRVRLINLLTRHVYDERTITLPVGTWGNQGSGGDRPTITSFTTCCATVRADQLAARTARVPVSWTTANRPITANLVFEQVLPDGSLINVELPRSNPWVASAGDGVAAPVSPGNNAATLLLRVRLIDLVDGRVYDQQDLPVSIDYSPAPAPVIRYFYTNYASVDARELAARTARVPVFWAVDNRPDNSNLVFEQVLPDGSAINVELPRSNPWVASSGAGVAAPVMPQNATTILLRVRLVNLADQSTITSREITLPISGQSNVEIISFAATPSSAQPGQTITLSWDVRGASSVNIREILSNGRFGQWYHNLSLSGSFQLVMPNESITYMLLADGIDGTTITRQITVSIGTPPADTPQIKAFTATPNPAPRGSTLTLTWEVTGAVNVTITRVSEQDDSSPAAVASQTRLSGSVTYALPADAVDSISFALVATDANGRSASQTITVQITCPYSDTLTGDCPAAQESVQAAYQSFEGGHMVWMGNTREIYVLFGDGSYQKYPDTWVEGETIDTGDTPPDGRLAPERGFGKVWATTPGVREKLGWALNAEQGYTTLLETHPGQTQPTALLFRLPDGRTIRIETTWQVQ